MTRKKRILLVSSLMLVAVVALLLVGLWLVVSHEPAFYRRTLAVDAAKLAKASDRMVRHVAAMHNIGQRSGRWEVVITADELNGWLAVDRAKNHPNMLPPTMHDPRVAIDTTGITAACRFEHGAVTSVLSLKVKPYLSATNVIGLRIVRGRAGALPLPLSQVLESLSEAARAADVSLQWKHTHGDPVALFSVPVNEESSRIVQIETIELRDGEIYIAGSTHRR
ncbi:MAG: hypothetical protein LLG00_16395 [Planctomycetaceae bacterium]|nr:hypothetical protein [Planctomycetaceae bacterium]